MGRLASAHDLERDRARYGFPGRVTDRGGERVTGRSSSGPRYGIDAEPIGRARPDADWYAIHCTAHGSLIVEGAGTRIHVSLVSRTDVEIRALDRRAAALEHL